MEPYGVRLEKQLERFGNLCVGIDPHPELLDQWGLPDSAAGVREFSLRVLEACEGSAGIVKPQSAFFEKYGSAGIAVLEEVLSLCRERGLLSILDVKRGDIGSTMRAYAEAYLREGSPLAADAITVSPFLGVGSLDEAFRLAAENNRGLYVLALTSNPEGKEVQLATDTSDNSVVNSVLQQVYSRNAVHCDQTHLGAFGVVIGATTADLVEQGKVEVSNFNGSYLVPGLGAQGGDPVQVRAIFGPRINYAIASASRSILRCGPTVPAMKEAIVQTLAELNFTTK